METIGNNDFKEFARLLTAWRLSRGWTQEDLAMRADVSKSAISQIERASTEAMPKPITLGKLAQAFNVPVSALFQSPDVVKQMEEAKAPGNVRVVEPGEISVTPRQSGLVPHCMRDGDGELVRIRRLFCASPETPDGILLPAVFLKATLATEYPIEQLRAIVIEDDTMAPTLQRGDVVLAVPISDGKFPGSGLFFVRYSNLCAPRRVTMSMSGGIVLSVDNPLFREPRAALRYEEVRAEARIVFSLRAIRVS